MRRRAASQPVPAVDVGQRLVRHRVRGIQKRDRLHGLRPGVRQLERVILRETLLGAGLLALQVGHWVRGDHPGGTSAVLLASGLFASLPVVATMLDWDRYYIQLVYFVTLFQLVGMQHTFILLARFRRVN